MSEYGDRDFASGNDIRALIGAILIVCGMVCFWYWAYQCMKCLHEKEHGRNKRVMVVHHAVSCGV